MACTQLQPIRITTLAVTGNRLPRVPNAPRVSAIVGRPVLVPMLPTSVRTTAPQRVPSTIIATAVANPTAGISSVPVNNVVTTRLAASQIMPIRGSERVPRTGPALSAWASRRRSRRLYNDMGASPAVGSLGGGRQVFVQGDETAAVEAEHDRFAFACGLLALTRCDGRD